MEILKCVTPVFLEEWRDYKEKLSMCIGEEQEKLEIADYTDVRQFLQRLSGAMEDMDVDAADAIMERLQQFKYSATVQTLMEGLSMAVLNLDGEQVEKQIAKITNEMERK